MYLFIHVCVCVCVSVGVYVCLCVIGESFKCAMGICVTARNKI
jgi:hypothetical protein